MVDSQLKLRLIELVARLKADIAVVHQRIDGPLNTAEKTSLAGAINELVRKNIAVGISPPSSPSLNDLWVDTN